MRAALVTFSSLALTFMVIANAYYQKKQFYTSVIYVTKSSPSMAILYMQAFVMVYLLGKLMRKLFFGQLRPAEMEHLMEKAWYAVTETCLAFTVFRDDFGTKFVAMFTILLFLKCFHWLAEDRVDYMERSPIIHTLFHIRAIGLLSVLCTLDFIFISHAYKSTITRGATVQLVFGFEYAILLLSIVSVSLRYILHVIDSRRDTPWENKAVYLLYSDFVIAGVRVIIYLMFLIIMIRIHTLPLFAIRPIYLSMRFFKKAFHDVVMSRRAIRYMNTVFPTVTAADLEASDPVCIICREEMQAGADGGAKKLPCGHLFHASCLRSWFQRQQTCPTCRMDILRSGGQPQNARAGPAQQQQQPQPQASQQQPQSQAQSVNGSQRPTPPADQAQASASARANLQNFFSAFPGVSNGASPPVGMPPPVPPMPPMMPGMPMFMGGFPNLIGSGMPDLSNVNLANLSDEQLTEMEGHGRRAVEARLETLRRIQTLLDAAVIQMHGYMLSVNATGPPPPVTDAKVSAATDAQTKGDASDISNDKESRDDDQSKSVNEVSGGQTNAKVGDEVVETLNSTERQLSTGNLADSEDSMAEIRRRRLERFDSQKGTNE